MYHTKRVDTFYCISTTKFCSSSSNQKLHFSQSSQRVCLCFEMTAAADDNIVAWVAICCTKEPKVGKNAKMEFS
jgi:hypothetical protein